MSLPTPLPTPWVLDAQRDPPVYTRPLVGSEVVMQRVWNSANGAGQVCLGINFVSSLEVEELTRRVRAAFDKLRFVCPIIACTIEGVASPRWVYTPSADREAWLDLAFAVEERGTSLDPSQFIQGTSLRLLPYADENGTTTLFRAYLLTTSKEGDDESKEYGLYFHGSHSIIDVEPAFQVLNLMCEWISGEGTDVIVDPLEEWKNLAIDPVTATGGPSEEWGTGGMGLVTEFGAQNARSSPCHMLTVPSQPLDMADPPFHHSITVSEPETASIVASTEKLGVSVSTLFRAAHCLAQLKINPIDEAVTEVDFSSSEATTPLEPYLKPPADPRTHLISSFSLVPLRFSMTDPLKEPTEKGRLIQTAKLVQERLDKYLPDPCLPHLLVVMAGSSAPPAQQDNNPEYRGPAETEDTRPWTSTYNYLGVIEERLHTQHGKIAVGSMCLGSRVGKNLAVHMWTMDSKIHIQVLGATSWGEESMIRLLEEMVRIALLVVTDES